MIGLGVKAKDKITGFEGIVTGRAQYLTGCDQYSLTPTVDADGKIREGQWFDEGRLVITGAGIVPESVKSERPGGPQRDAAPIR